MQGRQMPEQVRYGSLKEFVAKRGGLRLAIHGGLRDQLVEMAVEDYPLDAPPDRMEDVLAARLRLRCRKKYGTVVAMLLISILANLVARAVWEWWKNRHVHRVLMTGWQYAAKNPDLPPEVAGPSA
jgi:hypothetical protein